MKGRILVVKFHDNDFVNALHLMGKQLLYYGFETTKIMVEDKNCGKLFTKMFQLCVALTNGFSHFNLSDMDSSKKLREIEDFYTVDPYFDLTGRVELVRHHDFKWENSEWLVVDFNTDKYYVI